jgi:hypothetical protein
VLAVGAGEAAPLVAEELALDQVRRHGAAVDGKEGLLVAAAEAVDGLRHQLLARARLSEQQHRGVGGRHLRDHVVHALHHGRGPDERPEAAELAQLATQGADLLLQLPSAHDVREHGAHAREVHGLHQVIGSPLAHRLHGRIHAGLARDEHDLGGGSGLEVAEQVETRAVGQVQVDEDDVGHRAADLRTRFLQCMRGLRREPFAPHDLGESQHEVHVVVDEQCVRHHCSVRCRTTWPREGNDSWAFIRSGRGVQEASHGEGTHSRTTPIP